PPEGAARANEGAGRGLHPRGHRSGAAALRAPPAGADVAAFWRGVEYGEATSMSLVVMKFGGTSVANPERIRNVAQRCIATQKKGHDVVVIVSAMAGETNRLIGLAHELGGEIPDAREMDALAATGEQVTAALTALTIQQLGGQARSLL